MQLSDLLTPERVKVPLQGSSKDELMRELVGVLVQAGTVADAEAVLGAVRAREAVLSTGIGGGVAIPHGKSPAAPELVLAAGVTAAPVDFASLDGEPVRLVFLLVGPHSAAGAHVKALGRISRLLRRETVRAGLVGCADGDAFIRFLREAEAEP